MEETARFSPLGGTFKNTPAAQKIFNSVAFNESRVGTGSSSTNELIAVFVIDTTLPDVRPCPVASPQIAIHFHLLFA